MGEIIFTVLTAIYIYTYQPTPIMIVFKIIVYYCYHGILMGYIGY